MLKANGLTLKEISSKAEPVTVNNLNDAIMLFNSDGFVVAYLDYKVLVGRIKDRAFQFYNDETIEEKYIQKMRIFNRDKELLLWRTNSGLKGRIRTDEEGKGTYVVEADQVLWGTKAEPLGNGWTRIREDRGTEIILPFSNIGVDNKKGRLFIRTRNYVDFYNDIQATYVDCRFVCFVDKDKNPLV